MKWKLVSVEQETNHRFLNQFILHYEVSKEDGSVAPYAYFMASRNSAETIRPVSHNYDRPDGVIMALYYEDPETKKISILMTSQFRPAMGTTMTSFPAGLLDKEDSDIVVAAKREAQEEAGVILTDVEILAPGSASSSGLSDEENGFILARISSFTHNELEEFEDIKTRLVPLEEIHAMMKDTEKYHIPLPVRLCLHYLLLRFQQK